MEKLLSMETCTFDSNFASSGRGWAIFAMEVGFTLLNSTFIVGNHTLSAGASLIHSSGHTIEYGDCAPGSTPGAAGINVPVDRGDFSGCPFTCPEGTSGPGGEASLLRKLKSGCELGCEACPAGATCGAPGLGAPNLCSPGHHNPDTGSQTDGSCRSCESGSFQTEVGATACVPCPAGSYVAAKGSTACSPCSAGGYCEDVGASSASVFQFCQPGTWSDTVGLNSSNGCQNCPIGTYQPITGASSSGSCLPCPMGTASAALGVPFCPRCKAGTVQSAEGQLACEPCPISSYCAAGSSAPTACPEGTIGPREGLRSDQECEPCPKGAWCSAGKAIPCGSNTFQPGISHDNAGACQQCPEDAVSPKSSVSIDNCKCRAGHYDSKPSPHEVSCEVCTAGTSCPTVGTQTATLNISVGWYRTSASSVDLRRCPDGSKEGSGCMGGIGDRGPCKLWLTGPYCRLCNVSDGSRYYNADESACLVCNDDAAGKVATLVTVVLAIALVAMLLLWLRPDQKVKCMVRMSHRLTSLYTQISLRAKFKQCLGFYQVATRVPGVFKVPFPKEAQSVLTIFEVFNVNIAGLSLPLSCMGLGNYWDRLLFTILFPIVIAACIFVCSVVYALSSKIRGDTVKGDRRWLVRIGGLLALPHLLTLSFLVFPMVSSAAFQAFPCEEFDDGSFLRADFAIECGSPEHDDVVTLAWIGIFLYPVGISLLYIVLFRKANRAILDEKPTALSRSLGFLTLDFDKVWFAWELIEAWKKCLMASVQPWHRLLSAHFATLLLHRLFLVGFCVLILPGTILQLLIAFVFSLLSMLLTAIVSPFKSDVDNSVAKAFGFALVIVYFFALIIKVNVLTESVAVYLAGQLKSDFSFDIVIVSAGMTVAVALALVVTVLVAVQQFVHAARTPIIKLRSTSGRPALTVNRGMTWHLFLSQCVASAFLESVGLSHPPPHTHSHARAGSCGSQHLEHGTRPVRHHQRPAINATSRCLHFP